tara:strand:- start:350535 stop:350807 length:273 start_codon:yes stop_codon:yes gene_type:complete
MLTTILVWTALASLTNAAFFLWDKRAAERGHRRIPERTLLLWSIAGGWPGGLMAGRWIRHKTQKVSFRIQFAACVVLNVTLVGWLLWSKS